jgi:hypothetical protein
MCVYLLSDLLTVKPNVWSTAISCQSPLIRELRRYIGTKLISEINFSLWPAVCMTMRSRSSPLGYDRPFSNKDINEHTASGNFGNAASDVASEGSQKESKYHYTRKHAQMERLILWTSCDAVTFGAKIS